MKTVYTSSKLFKIKRKWKFFIFLVLSMIGLVLPSLIVTKHSAIEGSLTCEKIETKELSCKFNCSIIPVYGSNVKKELYGRVIVFHSLWTAIFDRTYRIESLNTNQFEIELPKRGYAYSAVVSMYDDSNNIGVSNRVMLIC